MGNIAYERTVGKVTFLGGNLEGNWNVKRSGIATTWGASVPASDFESVTVVTAENRHRLGKTLGTAAIGGLLLGPVGLLGGALFGKKQLVTFVATLTDNRQVLARADQRAFETILAFTFR